ncbi:MAG: aminomethyl-transferring glycine dehydrogenase [Verrucomicrobiales bacterium]|nr:aminomethyl-transferring glycine dehydrogenase [Verrucomicrobiales bacterium]
MPVLIVSTFPDRSVFAGRHLGPDSDDVASMLHDMGLDSLDDLIANVVPGGIRSKKPGLELPGARSEYQAVSELKEIAGENEVWRSLIGRGYYDTVLPPVIQRNVLENPGWYTAYTPYQAEISQGRLEALLNFQTLICELAGLPVANASLLDEATAAAEAMAMAAAAKPKASKFYVCEKTFSQTVDVLQTRAEPVGIELIVTDLDQVDFAAEADSLIGVLVQYPDAKGGICDYSDLADQVHTAKGVLVAAADILALTLLKPPGSWGADIAIGSAQRFGVPMGFGGPHAAFIACSDSHKRRLPGRLVGVSKDSGGRAALRLSLQTREQHIRREKATSNICTAQVLLAVIAGFYATYHGKSGLRRIALNIASATRSLGDALKTSGYTLKNDDQYFDTLTISKCPEDTAEILKRAAELKINLRQDGDGEIGLSLDEGAIESGDWKKLSQVFNIPDLESSGQISISESGLRDENFLDQTIFKKHHTETRMLRYLRRLEGKDIALNWSMIPLGSCTMKLNATSEMLPISWPEINALHPFVPSEQVRGYAKITKQLEDWLSEITGFAAVNLQPNAGSQGEYAGLLAIRGYHLERGDTGRTICLIPTSAHGTNPASAVMAGMKVVPVKCDAEGNIDLADIREKAEKHAHELSALMITYPSTHGVFEETVVEICEIIHAHGGQVYMDGANMNAQVGLCSPGEIGADVCHLNLHKTFCIPHGGGGPGVGPIGVAQHLVPFLPGHRDSENGNGGGVVAAAPYGSASILTISWMYIAMMGPDGLTKATELAILNANYIAHRLKNYFPVLYRGKQGYVAHECIIDLRPVKEETGIDVEDVAKRLIDFGFHAPTMSWPVPGTLMIEPTESEDLAELDRFCDAMIAIHAEIKAVGSGKFDSEDNPLKNSPHPAEDIIVGEWEHAYTREQAAYPAAWVRERKFWPSVSRIDNVFGDRNLVCTCEGMDAYSE